MVEFHLVVPSSINSAREIATYIQFRSLSFAQCYNHSAGAFGASASSRAGTEGRRFWLVNGTEYGPCGPTQRRECNVN